MEAVLSEEARLRSLRSNLLEQFDSTLCDSELNPVVVLEKINTLKHRCTELQKQVLELGKVKQDLSLALHQSDLSFVSSSVSLSAASKKSLQVAASTSRQAQSSISPSPTLLHSPPSLNLGLKEDNGEQEDEKDTEDQREWDKENRENSKSNWNKGEKRRSTEFLRKKDRRRSEEGERVFQVDEAAFEALAESVRGRAKVEEVKKTLDIVVALWKRKNGSRKAGKLNRRLTASESEMSLKELDAAGAKVVGHTGSCILASLKALHLIRMSRQGVSLNLSN